MQPNNPGMPPYQPRPSGQQPYQSPAVPPSAHNLPAHSHAKWIIAISVLAVLLLGTLTFAIWAFSERQTYKNDTDAIVEREVALASELVASEKDNEFLEREKNPLKTYQGPAQYGSIKLLYPKTWSALFDETNGSAPLDGYLNPNFVPGLQSGTAFALRVEVINNTYDQELEMYAGSVELGTATLQPFRAAKVPDLLGSRVDGQIDDSGKKGSAVILPLRDKTLKITTEAESFIKDFNEIILPNLEFSP